MFINTMRSNQRWLMGVISVLVIISFIWFYSDRTQVDRMVSDRVGSIYGRALTSIEVDRVDRQLQTAADLGLRNLVSGEAIGRGDKLDAVVNHLVIAHQAEAMGILPTNDEVEAAVQKVTLFQTPSGQFDPTKYAEFVSDKLTPRGFSEDQMDELVRQDIQFGKLREIVDAPVVVSPQDARLAYEQYYAKTNASVIRLKESDFAAGIKEPTDDEIKKYYDDQKDQYIQPEKRKVAYVKFGLTDDQKKLVGKPKMDALQPLANQAFALVSDLLDNKGKTDLATAAAKAGVPVKETPDFEKAQPGVLPEASISGLRAGGVQAHEERSRQRRTAASPAAAASARRLLRPASCEHHAAEAADAGRSASEGHRSHQGRAHPRRCRGQGGRGADEGGGRAQGRQILRRCRQGRRANGPGSARVLASRTGALDAGCVRYRADDPGTRHG